jgi:hypothetical protein
MDRPPLFKWRHFTGELILCAVRWYLRYALSYRDVEELLRERGVAVDHTTVFRWVQRYAPEIDKRCRPLLRRTNASYRVDETYIRIKKQWYYLYRAVGSVVQVMRAGAWLCRNALHSKPMYMRKLEESITCLSLPGYDHPACCGLMTSVAMVQEKPHARLRQQSLPRTVHRDGSPPRV